MGKRASKEKLDKEIPNKDRRDIVLYPQYFHHTTSASSNPPSSVLHLPDEASSCHSRYSLEKNAMRRPISTLVLTFVGKMKQSTDKQVPCAGDPISLEAVSKTEMEDLKKYVKDTNSRSNH